jgi:hypothetical protein
MSEIVAGTFNFEIKTHKILSHPESRLVVKDPVIYTEAV